MTPKLKLTKSKNPALANPKATLNTLLLGCPEKKENCPLDKMVQLRQARPTEAFKSIEEMSDSEAEKLVKRHLKCMGKKFV